MDDEYPELPPMDLIPPDTGKPFQEFRYVTTDVAIRMLRYAEQSCKAEDPENVIMFGDMDETVDALAPDTEHEVMGFGVAQEDDSICVIIVRFKLNDEQEEDFCESMINTSYELASEMRIRYMSRTRAAFQRARENMWVNPDA